MTEKSIPGVDVQDNKREKALAEILGLQTTGKRSGFDAYDVLGNPYELKTTSKNDVGTGRDIGRAFIKKLGKEYFVAAKSSLEPGEWKPSEIIVCHPDDLEGWIEAKLGSRLSADESLMSRVTEKISKVFEKEEIDRIKYLIMRGMTYNNPKISWDYLIKNGTQLALTNAAQELKEFVNSRPLPK
jgi:hypothetical protein